MRTRRTSCMALCMGAIIGPIAGIVVAPLAFVGAACALLSIVLASTHLHDKV